ncbi:amylo-alpha-1,6-glucosidase [Leifsonia sp. NPDC056665]|uniref:amylo-alpha-1,6-glucosidase n=1 Tax=Leifsonia sp. NPDC056665 TaxID=3345901 RepID=UPI0036AC5364
MRAADRVSPFLDLESAPFTLPGSRILVFRDAGLPDALTIRLAEYERDLDDCVLVRTLRVLDSDGRAVAISAVHPDRISFGADVTLTFDGPSALSIGGDGVWTVEVDLPSGDAPVALASADGAVRITSTGLSRGAAHADALAATSRIWEDWFARTPAVRADLADMTAFCWWVLGANIVSLPGRGARAVVPSKIGYVGLWQWDAYFIASGLRHGDPDLAREQLELAFAFPGADGQLPDVVHDEGILASSDDLPPGDRENLRRAGSAIADPTAPIPLTKPPLAAWALRRLEGYVDDPAFFDSAWETVARSQDWWFAHSDLDGDGMPEYGHPYSSGLDDSPVFDAELPVASPDLAAYLILQDDLLAGRARAIGDVDGASLHTSRASRTLALLEAMWDESAGYFRSYGAGTPVDAETAVSLLPLLTGRLPGRYVAGILAALDDPTRFATTWSVPTVARREPDYSDERMWRGPVWVNVNALLAEGLAVSGQPERSRALIEETLRLVMHGGGPHEYYNPSTGGKPPRATTAFGWSAALFVDLAVQISG